MSTSIPRAQDRQRSIYLGGAAGEKPRIPVDPAALREAARKVMRPEAFAYVDGGAGLEETLRHNRSGFDRWRIVPRMLRDVSSRDTSVKLLGRELPAPLLTCPIGVLDMAHREADLAVARATSRLGLPMIFSSQASVSMEDCAAAMGEGPRWFQLYWSKNDDLTRSLVQRAENCGCEALVLTLDTTMLGWRMRDLDLAYLPFLRGRGIAQYVSDPVFQRLLDEPDEEEAPPRKVTLAAIRTLFEQVGRYPGRFWPNLRSGRSIRAVRTFIRIYSRPELTWQDLARLREMTRLPIFLKGILHPEDARLAVEQGMDGLIVSNHGGRQVDGALSAIAALPEIARSVAGRLPVLMDSGIRSGADVFKALALGADAVCVGRPYVYALALAGEAGVHELLLNLMADFELTMGLAGCRHRGEIKQETLTTLNRDH